jgi:transposase
MLDTVRAGTVFLADRVYDSSALRERLAERGARGNIRAMPHRLEPPAFSRWLYKQRNAVERFFKKLKHFRAVTTRYDKRDDNYLASVRPASPRIWLRFDESVT